MNIVDWVIIGILGISVLFGLYRGFISSVLNMGGGLASFFGAFWLYPKLAALIQGNESLRLTLAHYLEPGSGLDLALSESPVATLGSSGIQQVLSKVSLPAPLDAILQVNLEHNVFANLNITTVGEYVNQTVLMASINILCFVLCFLAAYIAISILFNLIRAVFRFPELKRLDSLCGGVFGLLRGLLLCLVLFTLVPLVQTMVPLDLIGDLLSESMLASAFMNGNLITAIMNGSL
ncbi:MAG: CvpA family protein [Clostridia bacterium]|nr:CvpA family protein [Clostridia bacterium]